MVTWTLTFSLLACSQTYSTEDEEGPGGVPERLGGTEDPGDTASDTANPDDTAASWHNPDDDPPEDTEEPVPAGGEWVCDEEIRNGSEICDDAGFDVPDPYGPMALVCVTGEGGIGYVSTNTGPEMSDGMRRCQGWEENGQDAWDHLDYLYQVRCDHDGQVKEVDLRAWTGRGLYTGVHDHPEGGGHMTHTCIANWVRD